ncbi:MAG: hypothetical protein AB1810_14505 [Pseudomonadota bacterium]
MNNALFAWVLPCGNQYQIAVAEYQMVEFVQNPACIEVPLTPAHCRSGLIWRKHFAPIVDLARLAGASHTETMNGVTIIAYQPQPHAPVGYLALRNTAPPTRVVISDEQACPLPEDYPQAWLELTLSCVSIQGRATPILDLSRLGMKPRPDRRAA